MKPDAVAERDEERAYVERALSWYLSLPDTPARVSRADHQLAVALYARRTSLPEMEAAILLAAARRHLRAADAAPLSPVRSLSYFLPVLEEIRRSPLPAGYAEYLRGKLRSQSGIVFPD